MNVRRAIPLSQTLRYLLAFPLLIAFAFAFGLLDLDAIGADDSASPLAFQLEFWFFDPSGSSPGLVALVCAGLVWLRWPKWAVAAKPDGAPSRWRKLATVFGGLACAGSLAWAELNGAADLRFVALGFFLATWATWAGGRAGLAEMSTPCLVLLLALPIPFPLRNEVLWSLQNFSAAGSAWLLGSLGFDISRSGAHLLYGDLAFLVIEGCSGLRSLLTMILVSIVLRDLLELRDRRGWILLLAAPPLALVLNVIRISIIMLGATPGDPGLEDEHIGQGLAVLLAGTFILFLSGHFLAGAPSPPEARPGFRHFVSAARIPALSVGLAILCALRIALAPWPLPDWEKPREILAASGAGWTSTEVPLDYPFVGVLPRGAIETRVYQRSRPVDRLGFRPVDVLIARSSASRPRESPVSTKLIAPGREWQIVSTESTRHYTLGRSIDVSVVASREGRSLVYSWSVNAGSLAGDSLRSLLAIERGPFARAQPRFMVHLAADLGTEPEAYAHSRKILDRFVHDFRADLKALEGGA